MPFRLALLFTLAPAAGLHAADAPWPRFRGPDGTGVVASGVASGVGLAGVTADDFAWKTDLPGSGHGSPAVAAGRVFVAASRPDGIRGFYALDAATGTIVFRDELALGLDARHAQASFASITPATDGEVVVCAFADDARHVATAYDVSEIGGDGDAIRWRVDLPPYDCEHGYGLSSVVVPDAPGRPLVLIANAGRGVGAVLALDAETGRTVWEAPLTESEKSTYCTPLVLRDDAGRPTAAVAASSGGGLAAFAINDGRELWATGKLPARAIASPVLAGGSVLLTTGGGKGGRELLFVDPADGRVTRRMKRGLPYVPTPVANERHLFLFTDTGVAACHDLGTGKRLGRTRAGSGFDGSPILLGDELLAIDNDGVLRVLTADRDLKEVATLDLGERSSATPAYADGRLYLRTEGRLFCLEVSKRSAAE